MIHRVWLFILSVVATMAVSQAMIYDNRFWPVYPQRFFAYQAYPYASWYFSARGIFIGADSAFLENDDEVGLFDVFGSYDERAINTAVQKAGLSATSLVRPDLLQLGPLPWLQPGKISTRGVAFETEVYVHHHLSFGGSLYVGERNAHAHHIFKNELQFNAADLAELRASHDQLLNALNLTPPCEHSAVFGDTDLYVKARVTRDYWLKIHHLDIGARFGVWMPSGTRGSLYNPLSLPIGGNGHWGLYGQLDGMFLLNDVISVGMILNVSKRLPKAGLHRLPLANEPVPYGALLACACVSPGVTIAFNPYVQFGGIREGLGLAGGYFMIWHASDRWSVASDIEKQFSPNLKALQEQSSWGSDHFSVAAYYDFGFEKSDSCSAPIVSLTVDIPWKGPVTKRVPKSHAISLRIESRI